MIARRYDIDQSSGLTDDHVWVTQSQLQGDLWPASPQYEDWQLKQ
jgi:hypothetical protein